MMIPSHSRSHSCCAILSSDAPSPPSLLYLPEPSNTTVKKHLLKQIRRLHRSAPGQRRDRKGVKVIDLKQARALHDQKAHFYDAREKRHFHKSRIKGARPVHFDVSKAEYMVIELPREKEQPLVFYCYGESCANSCEAALAVRKLGHKNVYWFLNGFNEWKEKGYPLEER